MTNYELGIVFSLEDEADIDRVVCYQRPPRRYGSKDRPWVSCSLLEVVFRISAQQFEQMQEESEVLNGA